MPIRNAMDLIKLRISYTGQRKDTAQRNKSEVWRSVRNEKKLNISKISIIKAGIEFYGKEYLKNYFIGKDGDIFYDELLIELCKENEIENKEDFEKIWK